MRMFKSFGILLLLSISTYHAHAQEQLGLRQERYSGVNSLGLNPANHLSGAFNWDVNLAGAAAFGQTNYGFIYNTNIPEILRLLPEGKGDVALNYSNENQYPEDVLIADFNDSNRKKYVNGSATVLGPAVSIRLASGHSFGIFTNLRAAASGQGIPRELSYYFFDRTPYAEEFDVDPFIGAGMSWSEVGVNYARRIELSSGNLDLGVSLKFLNGYEAFFMNNNKTFGLTQFEGDTLSFADADFEYGLTTGNTSGDDFNLNRNGGGLAVDLGAVFTIEGTEGIYQWKFGAALLDIGRINFTENTESHAINSTSLFSVPTQDYNNVDDVNDVLTMISEQALGAPSETLVAQDFSLWLPGALVLHSDYRVSEHIFANATLIQRLPYKKNAVKRGNMLALTPRFEQRWLSASLPISLYNYDKVRIGAALRLAFITVGTEHLGSLIGKSNFTGSDIYFAIRVNPFNIGLGSIGGGRGGKRVKCYEF